jgi:transposase
MSVIFMEDIMQDTPSLTEASKLKRRFFTAGHKQRIVQEALTPGASVLRIARLYDVNANQVFKWKREFLHSQIGIRPGEPGLLPVVVTDPERSSMRDALSSDQRQATPAQDGSIELNLPRGRVVLTGNVNTEVLRLVLHTLVR